MELRLAYSPAEWHCQVYLRFEKDDYGNRLPDVTERPFGPVLLVKKELEVMLRRAQLAVLNPMTPMDDFLDLDVDTDFANQLPFSSNVVCINVSGPDIPDLSFIDLPGVLDDSVVAPFRSLITL